MADKNHRVDLVKTGRSYGSVRDPVSTTGSKLFTTPSKAEVGSRSVSSSRGLGVIALVVGLLLVVSVMKTMMSSDPLTFAGLLETLSSAPTIDMSMTSFYTITELTWSEPFNGIASFINFFITIFNVLIFCFKGLGQVAVYLLYFVRFLFVG